MWAIQTPPTIPVRRIQHAESKNDKVEGLNRVYNQSQKLMLESKAGPVNLYLDAEDAY
jgi:hypothetical protein